MSGRVSAPTWHTVAVPDEQSTTPGSQVGELADTPPDLSQAPVVPSNCQESTLAQRPKRAPLPHGLVLALTISSVVTGLASSVTAILNYREARRNNLQPGIPSTTAYVIRRPQGLDLGEFEYLIKNDGKTPIRNVRISHAIGVAVKKRYSRGGPGDPEILAAYLAATGALDRDEVFLKIDEIVQRQRPTRAQVITSVDFMTAGQVASLWGIGWFLPDAFQQLVSTGKGYLVLAGAVDYSTEDGEAKRTRFCFEHHPASEQPGQRELLSLCTGALVFMFP